MLKVAVIVGSTRPGRKAEAVAQWVHAIAVNRKDAFWARAAQQHASNITGMMILKVRRTVG